MGERETLRITNVNVFDSVAGRVDGRPIPATGSTVPERP